MTLEAIRARHNADPIGPTLRTDWDSTPLCWACNGRWPCDAAQALALLDASREREKALAEALRDMLPAYHQTGSIRDHSDPTDRTGWNVKGAETCEDGMCVDARAALAAHEEAQP